MRKNCGLHGSTLHHFAVACSSAACGSSAPCRLRQPPPTPCPESRLCCRLHRVQRDAQPGQPAGCTGQAHPAGHHCRRLCPVLDALLRCAARLQVLERGKHLQLLRRRAGLQRVCHLADAATLWASPCACRQGKRGAGAARMHIRPAVCCKKWPCSCKRCRCPAANKVVSTCPSVRHVKGACPPQPLPPRPLAPQPALRPSSALPAGPPLMQVPVGTCLLMYGDLAGRSDMRLSANPSYNTGIWVERQRWL